MHGAYQSACRATLEFLKIFEETSKIDQKWYFPKNHQNDKKWKIQNEKFFNWDNCEMELKKEFSQIDNLE